MEFNKHIKGQNIPLAGCQIFQFLTIVQQLLKSHFAKNVSRETKGF